MEPDFSGYATKADLKCSDGRVIKPNAFQHQDTETVPLVWQHGHNDPSNVLGHAVLENRPDGVYCRAYFNETTQGKNAKALVVHGDVKRMSIWANGLTEKVVKGLKEVIHGNIREVSLVLAGANPGAVIDYVRIAHADGSEDIADDEAIIHTGLEFDSVETATDEDAEHATVREVFDSMTDDQKNVVYTMIGAALEQAGVKHSDTDPDEDGDEDEQDPDESDTDDEGQQDTKQDSTQEGDLQHKEGDTMSRNVFDNNGAGGATATKAPELTHEQVSEIFHNADEMGSLQKALEHAAGQYGIGNIELLFPDAKAFETEPELLARKQDWVVKVLNGASKRPFSRIKSLSADITLDEARAKGYVKGNLKKEEFFALTKRETGPTTIYKKQKLDRDDIIDVTTMDVVAWLWTEMRLMLDEEIARAILLGDGREVDDEDKIDESKIRPIAYDDDFYTHKVEVPANYDPEGFVEALTRARRYYKGTGNPTMFCTEDFVTDMLLSKDRMGRRLYATIAELATTLRVSEIVTVEVMEGHQVDGSELLAVLVNMSDYVIGTDRGGEISRFDDFDIDYNQYKYLLEGRMSGALMKHKRAMAILRAAGGTEVTPEVPTFNESTGVVTIPNQTGVVYENDQTGATLTAGPQAALSPGQSLFVRATPADGYYFPHNTDTTNEFKRPSA